MTDMAHDTLDSVQDEMRQVARGLRNAVKELKALRQAVVDAENDFKLTEAQTRLRIKKQHDDAGTKLTIPDLAALVYIECADLHFVWQSKLEERRAVSEIANAARDHLEALRTASANLRSIQ